MTFKMKRKYNSLALSAIGSSHQKNGKPCQDRSKRFSGWSHTAIVVCDGHGGSKHFRSGRGAEFGVKASEEVVEVFSKTFAKSKSFENYHACITSLAKSVLLKWREYVENDMKNDPLQENEMDDLSNKDIIELKENGVIAYGSTLLVSFICKNMLFIIQLGDGNCVVFKKDGTIELPIQEDNRLQFGKTTSLCEVNAMNNFRYAVIPIEQVKACFLSSDGVRNSFDTQENFHKFLKNIYELCRDNSLSESKQEIMNFLPKLSKNGSGDDVSLALMF